MKPRERGGVVDSRLNVYGLKGLKVAGKIYQSHIHVLNADYLCRRKYWRVET